MSEIMKFHTLLTHSWKLNCLNSSPRYWGKNVKVIKLRPRLLESVLLSFSRPIKLMWQKSRLF